MVTIVLALTRSGRRDSMSPVGFLPMHYVLSCMWSFRSPYIQCNPLRTRQESRYPLDSMTALPVPNDPLSPLQSLRMPATHPSAN